MNNGKIHVNAYASRLLSDRHFCNLEYHRFSENCYSINNIYGNIAPNILNCVIRRAKWNKKIRRFLSDILLYVDQNSISDRNFRLLMQFRGRCRNTFLANIAHADLAFYQMQIINRYSGAFEAFGWLFNHICQHDCFNEEDMLHILKDNVHITAIGVQSCIDSAVEAYGMSAKLNIAIMWINDKRHKK